MLKKIDWKVIASLLVLLFYLPMLIHTQYNSDILTLYDLPNTKVDVLGQMRDYLLTQAKPLFGIVNVFTPIFSIPAELVVAVGLCAFMFANFKLLDYFFASLSSFNKTMIFVLLGFNPYLYQESTWYEQFFYNGLLAIAIYYALVSIVKYHNDRFSFKKLIMVYVLPILVVVVSLNFFMTIYFHFIVLAMSFVLKRHFDNNFNNIKEVMLYAKPFLMVAILGGLIYVAEIFSLWSILGHSYEDFQNSQPWRTENIPFFIRLIKLPLKYTQIYNLIGMVVLFYLLLKNKSLTKSASLFLFIATGVVYASSYIFFIVFGMRSTTILNYPNFYLTIILLGFFINRNKNNLKLIKQLKALLVSTILIFYGFMILSYFTFSQYEKKVALKLAKINQELETVAKVKNPPIVLLLKSGMGYKKNKILITFFTSNKSFHGFKGIYFGYPNINMPFTFSPKAKNIDQKVKTLRKAGKIYPNQESIFKINDTYYIVV